MKPVCPICRSELPISDHTSAFPFCSVRCKKLDLYRWLSEEYRISEPINPEAALEMELGEHGEVPN
jgi:endogenous inhibitor of DNA gyrase (YacG/DUF329 family)